MIIALIPARGGSKRVPRKNVKPLAGIPLVAHSIVAARTSRLINFTVVSTDDEEILDVAKQYGCLGHQRDQDAATDDAGDIEVVRDFMLDNVLGHHIKDAPDLIVYLRPTTPLRRVEWIDDAIRAFQRVETATGLRSVHLMSESAYKCFEVSPGNILQRMPGLGRIEDIDGANLPNHFYPPTYHPNGAVDIIRPENVIRGFLYGDRAMAYITPRVDEIDTPEDFSRIEWELRRREGMTFV